MCVSLLDIPVYSIGAGIDFNVMFKKKIIRSFKDKNTLAILSHSTPNKSKLWLLFYLEREGDLNQKIKSVGSQ